MSDVVVSPKRRTIERPGTGITRWMVGKSARKFLGRKCRPDGPGKAGEQQLDPGCTRDQNLTQVSSLYCPIAGDLTRRERWSVRRWSRHACTCRRQNRGAARSHAGAMQAARITFMPSKPRRSTEVTQLLTDMQRTAPGDVAQKLLPLVYEELRVVARKYLRAEQAGLTLQPTALVHEAYMRLVDQSRVDWQGRTHFLAVGANAMRRILIDHMRTRKRLKRGGNQKRVALEDTVLGGKVQEVDFGVLNGALDELATLDAEQAAIVELRFFGGLSVEEVALLLGVSKRKVESEWTHAKAWLKACLARSAE